ncbi:MAG: M56 family metallopeptidase [Pirellula sp.]
MNSLLNAISGILLNQSLQIGVVFLIVMIACVLLRRASAHWRYMLWLLVVAKCLTPPIVSFPLPVLPSQQITDTRSSNSEQVGIVGKKTPGIEELHVAASPGTTNTTPTIGELIASRTETGSVKQQPKTKTELVALSPQHWLALAWLTGVVAFLLIMAVKIWVTHRRIVRSRIAACAEMQEILIELARTSGIKKLPKLYEVDFAAQPFVWGWLGGDIYLSSDFSTSCSREKCRSMIAHELAHVSRWDAAVNHLQNLVQALFFFQPLVWIANKRLRLERERCCDEAVLSDSANSPRVYAEAIIDMLTRESESGKSTPALAVTGALKDIKARLVTILTPNRSFFRRPSRTSVFTLLLLGACVLPTVVVLTRSNLAVDDRNSQSNSVELKKFNWRFMDEAGKPVQGVLVTAAGMRCKEDPSSGYGWPTNVAPKTEYVTDANGEVNVEYPVNFGFEDGQGLTPTTLIFRCKHEQYISLGNIEVDVAVKNFTRIIERGCQVTLTCRGPEDLPIREFANLMPGWDSEIWKLEDGKLHSGSLAVGSTQTMLVVPDANGKHLFSEPVELICAKDQIFEREIVVQPGMTLSGKLADNVPRPIEQGKVMAFCVPKPLGPSFIETPAVSWTDEATISADGSFEFASLPPSESIQLIALCRGWLTDQWEQNVMAKGQIFDIDRDQIASKKVTDITLTMERAGVLKVHVVGPDGKPLPGAHVQTWPNQMYSHDFGTTLLGFAYSSKEYGESQIASKNPPVAETAAIGRYVAITDNDGIARLNDIPLNRPLEFSTYHEDYVVRDKPKLPSRGTKYQCNSPEPKKITVHMARPEKAIANTKVASAVDSDKEKAKKFTPSVLSSKVVKFDVDLLSQEQFMKSMQERMVSITPTMRKAMLDYSEGVQNPNPQLENTIKALRDGKDTLTLENVASVFGLGDQSALEVAKQLGEHDDPAVRFASNLTIATSATDDLTAAQTLHKLAHDKTLQLADRQLICTWCNGVGIRPDDTAEQIQQHFANVTSDEVKFKPGDNAPEFEFECETGTKISSKELRGRTIVIHFWATSCGPCMGQMPEHIKSLSKLDQSQVEVLFVSLDDDQEKFNEAVNKFQIPFTNLRDERGWGGDLVRAFGVRYMPLDIIIGPDGTIVSNSIQDLKHLMK